MSAEGATSVLVLTKNRPLVHRVHLFVVRVHDSMKSITRGFTRGVSHILSVFRFPTTAAENRDRGASWCFFILLSSSPSWCCWLRDSSAVQIALLSLCLVEKVPMEMWYCRGSRSFVRLALSPSSAMIVFRGFHVSCHGSVSLTKNQRPYIL